MIARLVGELADIGSGWAIVDVQGVGYEVLAPGRTLQEWNASAMTLHHIHLLCF